ncbi:MAG TPA: riboflavin synthase [Thermoanaerobaculia bacterium]|nr:riboflavin synthase [Thermoanaerobaculia bacterium]
MFTGIVVERGRLTEDPAPSGHGGVRLVIGHSPELGRRLEIGASLSVSGVCLTITSLHETLSTVELSPETLSRTTLGDLRGGSEVNLEPALRMGDALGGHMVQGHVDATARVVKRDDLDEHRVLGFSIPLELSVFLVEKGSVTVDGVSLTLSALHPNRFEVALIPHTLEVTTLSLLEPGDRVNLEVDVIAKYVQRMLAARGLVPEAV